MLVHIFVVALTGKKASPAQIPRTANRKKKFESTSRVTQGTHRTHTRHSEHSRTAVG